VAEEDAPPLAADRIALVVPAPDVGRVDVVIEGHRVWSVDVARREHDAQQRVRLPWPAELADRLRGKAVVEVRDGASGRVLARSLVRFDHTGGRPDLLDEAGRPLMLTKYGRLRPSFATLERDIVERYLDQTELVLEALRRHCGVPAFLSYGTLLGAVRDGRLIGHDLDIDLGYLARAQHPVDAMRESYGVERTLRERTDWTIVRRNAGLLQVFFPQEDGTRRNIDIFSCFAADGHVYQVHDTEFAGGLERILPLSTVVLEGRTLPAPKDADAFLEAAYGSSWRIPDPTFSYGASPTRRKLRAWFTGPRAERDKWTRFYTQRMSDLPVDPSPFARWVLPKLDAGLVLDVGCGNGRDSRFLADHGYQVQGFDVVPRALAAARLQSQGMATPPSFERVDLDSLRETLAFGARVSRMPDPVAIYARFLLHAVTPATREQFWALCAMVLGAGGTCFVEFRTKEDAKLPKRFPNRPRWFLDPDAVAAQVRTFGGREVERLQGRGLAAFGKEDPDVCRMVLEWG